MVPLYNPYSQLVYAARGSDVTTTVVEGKVLMENRQLTTMDVEQVMDDVTAIAAEIAAGDRRITPSEKRNAPDQRQA